MESTGTTATAPVTTQAPQAQEAPVNGAPAPTGGAQAGDVKAAAEEAARKLRIKFDDGNEQEIDENEVIETYKQRKKHQAVASRELNEGRALRRQNEELVAMLKDPERLWDVVKKLGHDPRELSERQLARVLEEELMDSREKELRDTRSKLERYEAEQKKKEEEIKQKRLLELGDKFRKEFETDFVEALKTTEIPSTKENVAKMASYIARSAKIGFKMSAKEAATLVKQDIEGSQMSLYKNASAEQLIKLLGEEKMNEIRKYDASRVKNPMSELKTPVEQSRREKAPTKRMSSREWQLHKRGLK